MENGKLLEHFVMREMEENSSFRKEVRTKLACIDEWVAGRKTERKILLYVMGLVVSAAAVIIPLVLSGSP